MSYCIAKLILYERSSIKMSKTILVTSAAGGNQGSTGNRILHVLVKRGFKVRALVHKIDERSQRLEKLGAEVLQGDLLDLNSVRKALRGVKRAYFTYPVDDGPRSPRPHEMSKQRWS